MTTVDVKKFQRFFDATRQNFLKVKRLFFWVRSLSAFSFELQISILDLLFMKWCLNFLAYPALVEFFFIVQKIFSFLFSFLDNNKNLFKISRNSAWNVRDFESKQIILLTLINPYHINLHQFFFVNINRFREEMKNVLEVSKSSEKRNFKSEYRWKIFPGKFSKNVGGWRRKFIDDENL